MRYKMYDMHMAHGTLCWFIIIKMILKHIRQYLFNLVAALQRRGSYIHNTILILRMGLLFIISNECEIRQDNGQLFTKVISKLILVVLSSTQWEHK